MTRLSRGPQAVLGKGTLKRTVDPRAVQAPILVAVTYVDRNRCSVIVLIDAVRVTDHAVAVSIVLPVLRTSIATIFTVPAARQLLLSKDGQVSFNADSFRSCTSLIETFLSRKSFYSNGTLYLMMAEEKLSGAEVRKKVLSQKRYLVVPLVLTAFISVALFANFQLSGEDVFVPGASFELPEDAFSFQSVDERYQPENITFNFTEQVNHVSVDSGMVVWRKGENSSVIHDIWANQTEELSFERKVTEVAVGDRKVLWRLSNETERGSKHYLPFYNRREDEWKDLNRELSSVSRKTGFSIEGDRLVWADSMRNGEPLGVDGIIDIYTYNLKTGVEKSLTPSDRKSRRLHLNRQTAPDISGEKVVWTDWKTLRETYIHMHNLETGETERITTNPVEDLRPQVSENHVVWERKTNLYLYSIEDEERERIARDSEFSLTDDRLIYTANNSIVSRNLETGEEETVLEVPDLNVRSLDASEDYFAAVVHPERESVEFSPDMSQEQVDKMVEEARPDWYQVIVKKLD